MAPPSHISPFSSSLFSLPFSLYLCTLPFLCVLLIPFPPLHSRFPIPSHILSQRDELSLVDDTHSGGSHVFKVFSQHHRSQSYAIHTNSTLAKQEWVGKIRMLKEEESFEQAVSLHTVRVHTKPLADSLAPFDECRQERCLDDFLNPPHSSYSTLDFSSSSVAVCREGVSYLPIVLCTRPYPKGEGLVTFGRSRGLH